MEYSLPNEVVSADSTNIFKNRLDKFWNNQNLKLIGKPTLPELEIVLLSVYSM